MKGFRKILLLIFVPFIFILLGYGIYKLFLVPPPSVTGLEGFSYLSAKKEIVLETKNLKDFSVEILQGLKKVKVIEKEYGRNPEFIKLIIKPVKLGLKDGPARVVVKMSSGLLKKDEKIIDSIIDTVPPEINILYAPLSLKTGEAGPVVVRVKDADDVYISLSSRRYKLYPFADDQYAGFIPVPVDLEDNSVCYAVAEDRAGNKTVTPLRTKIKKRRFKTSSINISEDFIKKVVLPMLGKTETSDPLSDFRQVNEKWRKRDEEVLRQLGRQSSGVFYIKGRFLQLKNSKVMARYGEHRKYYYKGELISESFHLGYDLASTAAAPVEAANRGKVVFSGSLGIYGNTVVIDHGLGLMSLYGHLSEIYVKKDQMVGKGQIIGRTGQTGFAAGDHLHFSILVQGEEVSPLYWWDPQWIRIHILEPLSVIGKG